jgi:hypothetical protein
MSSSDAMSSGAVDSIFLDLLKQDVEAIVHDLSRDPAEAVRWELYRLKWVMKVHEDKVRQILLTEGRSENLVKEMCYSAPLMMSEKELKISHKLLQGSYKCLSAVRYSFNTVVVNREMYNLVANVVELTRERMTYSVEQVKKNNELLTERGIPENRGWFKDYVKILNESKKENDKRYRPTEDNNEQDSDEPTSSKLAGSKLAGSKRKRGK